MLVDGQENALEAIRKADHWRLFEALLKELSLEAPLRSAIQSHINSVLAKHPGDQEVAIDSTAAGREVFGRLGTHWPSDYKQWHTAMCEQNPEFESITPERMYGMMLWYVLAADRPERWAAPPRDGKRVYKLLDRQAHAPLMSAERTLLIELRDDLRNQLARIEALLGNT